MVDIQHDDRRRAPVSTGACNLSLGGLDPAAACHRAGQPVAHGDLPKLQLVENEVGKALHHRDLGGIEAARPGINRAERAQIVAIGRCQRDAEIAADPGIARHKRVHREARIFRCVRNHHWLVPLNGVVAKGHLARGLAERQPDDGLEPLAFGVDQADGGDRHAHNVADKPGQLVERLLSGSIKDGIAAHGRQASLFVRQPLVIHHALSVPGLRRSVHPDTRRRPDRRHCAPAVHPNPRARD
ncbi:hypothetical protein FALB51S_02451 [Frigidibacter albus]